MKGRVSFFQFSYFVLFVLGLAKIFDHSEQLCPEVGFDGGAWGYGVADEEFAAIEDRFDTADTRVRAGYIKQLVDQLMPTSCGFYFAAGEGIDQGDKGFGDGGGESADCAVCANGE